MYCAAGQGKVRRLTQRVKCMHYPLIMTGTVGCGQTLDCAIRKSTFIDSWLNFTPRNEPQPQQKGEEQSIYHATRQSQYLSLLHLF